MAPNSCFRRSLNWPWDVLYPSSAGAPPKSLCGEESKQQVYIQLPCRRVPPTCVQTDKITHPARGRSCVEHPGPSWTKGWNFQLSHKNSLWLVLVFFLSPYFTVCLHFLWVQLFHKFYFHVFITTQKVLSVQLLLTSFQLVIIAFFFWEIGLKIFAFIHSVSDSC